MPRAWEVSASSSALRKRHTLMVFLCSQKSKRYQVYVWLITGNIETFLFLSFLLKNRLNFVLINDVYIYIYLYLPLSTLDLVATLFVATTLATLQLCPAPCRFSPSWLRACMINTTPFIYPFFRPKKIMFWTVRFFVWLYYFYIFALLMRF